MAGDSAEGGAIATLKKELSAAGGQMSVSVLSIKVKWGQKDLAQFGNVRAFIQKYPEVFELESNSVMLAGVPRASAPAAQDAAAGKPHARSADARGSRGDVADADARANGSKGPEPGERACESAVEKMRKELERSKGKMPLASLSIKVKWGQGDLAQLGNCRNFVQKYPLVLTIVGNEVQLVGFKSPEDAVVPAKPAAPPPAPWRPSASLPTADASRGEADPLNRKLDARARPATAATAAAAAPAHAAFAAAAHAVANASSASAISAGVTAPASATPAAANVAAILAAVDAKAAAAATKAPPAVPQAAKPRRVEVPRKAAQPPLDGAALLAAAGIVPAAKAPNVTPKGSLSTVAAERLPKKGMSPEYAAALKQIAAASVPGKDTAQVPAMTKELPAKAGAAGARLVGAKLAPAVPAKVPVAGDAAGAEQAPKGRVRDLKAPWVLNSSLLKNRAARVAKASAAVPRKAGWEGRVVPPPPKGSAAATAAASEGRDAGSSREPKSTPQPPNVGAEAAAIAKQGVSKASMGKAAPLRGPRLKPKGSKGKGDSKGDGKNDGKDDGKGDVKGDDKGDSKGSGKGDGKSGKSTLLTPSKPPLKKAALMAPTPAGPPVASAAPAPAAAQQEVELRVPKRKAWQMMELNDDELQALVKRIAPSEAYRKTCQKCTMLLKASVLSDSTASSGRGPVQIELSGSHEQKTELDGSDMDVVLRMSPAVSQGDREKYGGELRERLTSTQRFADHLLVHESMCSPRHTTSLMSVQTKNTTPTVVTHMLLGDLRPQSGGQATVDTAIDKLCCACDISRDLVRLVKLWATNHELLGQREGYLSGVAWTLVVIFFLQVQGLVPSYVDVLGADGGVRPQPAAVPSLSGLLRSFFQFIVGRVATGVSRGISVAHAKDFTTTEVLFVEDPVQMHGGGKRVNIAEGVSEAHWQRAVDEACQAADKLTIKPLLWFSWPEVFDPTEPPPQKIPRLAPLADALAGAQKASGSVGPNDAAKGSGEAADAAGKSGGKGLGEAADAGGKGGGGKWGGGKWGGGWGSWQASDSSAGSGWKAWGSYGGEAGGSTWTSAGKSGREWQA